MTVARVIPRELAGRYFPPASSAVLEARLHDETGQLIVTTSQGDRVAVVYERLSDRVGNVPRKIYFTDGGVFECADNDGVDLAFGKERHLSTQLTRWERSWKFVLVATVLTIGALFALYRWGLPAAAHLAADLTPAPVIAAIDAGARDTVDRLIFSQSNLGQERKQELSNLFDEIARASGHREPPLRLLFRDGGTIGPNAVALPGGTIILTDQLAALIEDDDEIAGVFAHEIGHVNERHSLRQIYRVLGLTFMISLIGGDSGQIVEEVLSQAVLLESFSYTRAFEASADAYSVRTMEAAGRDPIAFLDLLDRVYNEFGLDPDAETTWLDTHPGNRDRRKNVERLLAR